VDGPNVTVDYYSAMVNPTLSGGDYLITATPTLNFTMRETFGYGLNGRQFMVAEGDSYTVVSDTFGDTSARILSGTNASTATDSSGRALTRDVDTGWMPKNNGVLASDILTLWGMDDTGNPLNAEGDVTTGTYTLSMSYDPELPEHLGNGGFGIAARDSNGNWVNAVDLNLGGTRQFVKGAWKAGYGLGTYGVDPKTKTAWAVLNFNGSFAVANGIEPVPGHRD